MTLRLLDYPELDSVSNKLYIAEFIQWLGRRQITAASLLEYCTYLETRYNAPASRRRAISGIRPMLHWARLNKITGISKDDISDAFSMRGKAAFKLTRHEPQILRGPEIANLVKAALAYDSPDAVMLRRFVLLGITTGARPNELIAMKGTDFDVVNQEIHIMASKTMRERIVPLRWSRSLQALAPKVSTLGTFIKLTGPRGAPETSHWRKLLLIGQCPLCTPKILRATAASHVASSGKVPTPFVHGWFGHGDSVAWHYYQRPILVGDGNHLEDWFGCGDAMSALTGKVIEELV